MSARGGKPLQGRVVRAAEQALAERNVVSPIDVLIGVGWLAPSAVDRWRQGRADCLERVVPVNLSKLSDAMRIFAAWAREQGLNPSETEYVARTRDRRPLQFSVSGEAAIERAYRTHWVSPHLSEAKRRRLEERESKPPDLVVIWPVNDWTCAGCGAENAGLLMLDDSGPLCLDCVDLDHLVYLERGDATLTRRAKKKCGLSAVAVGFSRTRQRYERQGILVEEKALAEAEQECLADEEVRRRRSERAEERRAAQDIEFHAAFADAIKELFPGCPPERARAIAEHAGTRRSGRVGRSAAGRALDPEAVALAVVASVRHVDTTYDSLLMTGMPRDVARQQVADEVESVLRRWRLASVPTPPQPPRPVR